MKLRLLVLSCSISLATAASVACADSADTMNFRFSPIGLIVGSVDVGLDFAVAPQWTVGPQVNYWHRHVGASSGFTSDWDVKAYGVGARANWFKNGVYTDGLYVGPSLMYASVKVTNDDSFGTTTGTASGLFAGGLVGYGWYWSSFNMMLGGGFTVGLGDTKVTVTSSNGTKTDVSTSIAGLALEYSLGWTF